MPMASFRVVDSPEEASLHPRAIWNHCSTFFLWDHRSYYGMLEFIGALIMILGMPELNTRYSFERKSVSLIRMGTGALLLLGVCPIHWYSNQRQSTHFLTKARTHLAILIFLITATFVSQVVSHFLHECFFNCQVMDAMSTCLWLSILIRKYLLIATTVVWTITRNPRKDFTLAELPSPTDSENYYRPAWSSANVADGIEDDSLEPEGQVQLT
ncbi:hypothetical protein BYT27DRAFT_7140164 [Phlegmacium glaucopus]|nr:hypothetical protein BYT27DRAFT_7140164 [Phlegmacium glaucopus]